MFLDDNAFKNIIRNTPLISIDLIIQNEKDEYLVGKTNNRPKGKSFGLFTRAHTKK